MTELKKTKTKVVKTPKVSKPTRAEEIQKEIDEHVAKWKNVYNASAKLELSKLHISLASAIKANV